jgi:hypothetical protein
MLLPQMIEFGKLIAQLKGQSGKGAAKSNIHLESDLIPAQRTRGESGLDPR